MFKTFTLKTVLAFGAAVIALGGTSQAAMVYDDVMADTVWLTNINESSPTGDVSPLFGQPVASGDEFDFAPTGALSAQSNDGNGTDSTDGKLSFMVVAKPGYAIDIFEVFESGQATLLSAFANGDAFASVAGFVDIDINEIDGEPVSIELDSMNMSFTPNNGQYLHSAVANGLQETIGWEGGVVVDLAAEIAGLNASLGVTKITVTLDNILNATTQGGGTSAGIDKKDFDIIITTDGDPGTNNIPEPSTSLLLMVSTIAMTIKSRRNG